MRQTEVPNEEDALERLHHGLTLTVPEAAALLCISRSTAYAAARAGHLPTLRLGRRLVVPVPALRQMRACVTIALGLVSLLALGCSVTLVDAVNLYESGRNADAREKFVKLAEAGDPGAEYYLGRMSEEGRGTQKDYSKAVSWYHKAAEQGHMEAQNNLAWLYESGKNDFFR